MHQPLERLVPGQFMHQPKEIRDYLAAMWKIPQSGITEIRDQEVISDGHTYADLAVITKQLMCDYVGSEESFGRAWELTCAKAHSELHPPIGTIQAPILVTGTENIPSEVVLPANPPQDAKKGPKKSV